MQRWLCSLFILTYHLRNKAMSFCHSGNIFAILNEFKQMHLKLRCWCRQRHKMKNVILAHFKFYFGFLVFPFVSLLQLFCICLLLYCTSLYSLADTLRPIRVSLQSLSFYFYSFLVVQNLFVPSQFRYLCRSPQTFTFTFHVLF